MTAGLRSELVWQRTSPKRGAVEGPVLYQLIFRSSATPGNVPAIANNFTLTNSPISVTGSGIQVSGDVQASGHFIGDGSLLTNLPASAGTVTSVGLTAASSDFVVTGSPVTGSGTLSLNWNTPPTDGNVAGAIVKRDPNGNITANNVIVAHQFFGDGSQLTNLPAVTSVSLAAPALDFVVSGSPVSSSGTLSFNWNVAPTSLNNVNAIVKRDNTGSFTAGTMVATASIAATGGTPTMGTGVLANGTSTGAGVSGTGGSGNAPGVIGTGGGNAPGVIGNGSGFSAGVVGNASGNGTGVLGNGSGVGNGVGGTGGASSGFGGNFSGGNPNGAGVFATGAGTAAGGFFQGGNSNGAGVVAQGGGSTGLAGRFAGNVQITGNLDVSGTVTAPTKHFKIDHPLAPAEKYLVHAAVESSEVMDLYTGNAVLDRKGEAWIELPNWFEALNQDFRYVLTAIGAPGPNLYVAQEIRDHRFKIAGGTPLAKVSWQVTGVRHDAYMTAHPMQVEEDKPAEERGHYLHPELFGQTEEKAVGWVQHPQRH